MYIQRISKTVKSKTYRSVLLMESFRDGNKIRHRTIANLSKAPDDAVAAFDAALKGKKAGSVEDFISSTGRSIGGIAVIKEIASRLGILQALGGGTTGSLALLQIAARILKPGSRRYLAREWRLNQAVDFVFGLNEFDENALYENLDWLHSKQALIEKKIFNHRHPDGSVSPLFLYDVTSTYLEGDKNELAAYGYNRDKKAGKKQIVVGLLTDSLGYPVTVEVFKGNTQDPKTVAVQLKKLRDRFGVDKVIFIGDKGMVKQQQIDLLTSDDYRWDYLTTITKPQIEKLIRGGVIQMDMFETELIDIENDGIRYIARRNPTRATEIASNRIGKINECGKLCSSINEYLCSHVKASTEKATEKLQKYVDKLKLAGIISVTLTEKVLSIVVNEDALTEAKRFDGCYVMKTSVSKNELPAAMAHARYKDLAMVESAFRTMKTTIEDIRPVFLRIEERTRAHVFICSLAYMITKYIQEKTAATGATLKHVIDTLASIQTVRYSFGKAEFEKLPLRFSDQQNLILDALGVTIETSS